MQGRGAWCVIREGGRECDQMGGGQEQGGWGLSVVVMEGGLEEGGGREPDGVNEGRSVAGVARD